MQHIYDKLGVANRQNAPGSRPGTVRTTTRRPPSLLYTALVVAAVLLAIRVQPVSSSSGDTRVFTRVPSPGFPEGMAIRDGVVYVGTHTSAAGNVGGEPSKLFRYDLATGHLIGDMTIQGQNLDEVHGLTGMAFGPDGRLYVLDRDPPRMLALDFSASPPTQATYATFPDLAPCSSAPSPCTPSTNPGTALPDGLVFDVFGIAYVTDVQKATIFRVPAGGSPVEIWFQDARLDGVFGANGIVIGPSGKEVVFAVSISNQPETPNQGSIYSLPMVERPHPNELVLVHRYGEPFAAPDGIAFGRSGRLYVALAGANQVSVLDPEGKELGRFPTALDNARQEVPFDTPTSPVFDGRGSLFVTNQSFVNGNPDHWAVLETWVDDTALPAR